MPDWDRWPGFWLWNWIHRRWKQGLCIQGICRSCFPRIVHSSYWKKCLERVEISIPCTDPRQHWEFRNIHDTVRAPMLWHDRVSPFLYNAVSLCFPYCFSSLLLQVEISDESEEQGMNALDIKSVLMDVISLWLSVTLAALWEVCYLWQVLSLHLGDNVTANTDGKFCIVLSFIS